MNQSSTDSSISSRTGASAEAISRRAYEIWESEGHPEGADLRHWLQAEQELGADQARSGSQGAARAETQAARNANVDTRALQPARPPSSSGRDSRRSSASPFGEKSGQNVAKRKSSSAPML